MYTFIIRRLAFGAITVVGVSIVVFMVLRVLPGDPLVAIFGPEGYTKLSEAERAGYMAQLGLSDPLIVQYLHWLRDIASGSLGRSFFRAESVADMIARRGPLTAEIALIAVVLSWIAGIPVAIVSALRPNSIGDNVARFFQHPVPGGPRLLGRDADRPGPAVLVRLSRTARRSIAARRPDQKPPDRDRPGRRPRARTGRLHRADGALQPARSHPRGLRPHRPGQGAERPHGNQAARPAECAAAGHHAVRHPARLRACRLDPGRARFRRPGLGYAMFTAVAERDVFVMQNLVFMYAIVFVMLNILVDVTIAWLDPRIRYR